MFHTIGEDKARDFIKGLLRVRSDEEHHEEAGSDIQPNDISDEEEEEEQEQEEEMDVAVNVDVDVDVDTRKVEDLEEKQEQFATIFLNLVSLVKVMNSYQTPVNVRRYKELSIETYKLLATAFPWCQVPDSIHRILGHSWERIQENGSEHSGFFGLGMESEEGIEVSSYNLINCKEIPDW